MSKSSTLVHWQKYMLELLWPAPTRSRLCSSRLLREGSLDFAAVSHRHHWRTGNWQTWWKLLKPGDAEDVQDESGWNVWFETLQSARMWLEMWKHCSRCCRCAKEITLHGLKYLHFGDRENPWTRFWYISKFAQHQSAIFCLNHIHLALHVAMRFSRHSGTRIWSEHSWEWRPWWLGLDGDALSNSWWSQNMFQNMFGSNSSTKRLVISTSTWSIMSVIW